MSRDRLEEFRLELKNQLLAYAELHPLDDSLKQLITTAKKSPSNHKSTEESVLILSDIHGGKKTETYNLDVMKTRMVRAGDAVKSINRFMRSGYNLEVLHIMLLGDMVDGEDIFPGQAHQLEVPVVDQILNVNDALSDLIVSLGTVYKKIIVHGVRGNHGRKSKDSAPSTNFDTILYHMLELKFKGVDKVKFDISHDFYNVVDIQGKKFMMIHGHQISMYLNIPFYGLQRATASWTGSFKENFDYLVAGHFHITGMIPWNHKKILLNGTFVSSDDFGREVIKSSPSNTQWFLNVHRDRGITSRHEIDLLSDTERRHDKKRNW